LLCSDFVADHLASRQFHFQLLRLGKGDEKETQTMFLHLCQQLLACMRQDETKTAASTPSKKRKGASGVLPAAEEDLKALSSVMSALSRALSNLQGLLSVSGFVAVVQELLDDDDESHRRRALDLLPHRIESMQRDGGVSRDEAALFVDMANDLTASLDAHKDKATALCAVELLARAFAAKHPTPFSEALNAVTSLLESDSLDSDSATSAALLCSATLCGSLGSKAFPSLPRLMPIALRELADHREGGEDRQRPVLAMLVAFANSLAQFMHPYLASLLDKGAALASSSDPAVRHLSSILFARLANTVGLRLALPVVSAAFEVATGSLGSGDQGGAENDEQATWILGFFQQLVGAAAQKELVAHLPDLSLLLLEALKWEAVHQAAVGAVVAVVLRMNEHQLSAFFLELMAWKDATLSSRLTFFRVTEVLAERLKSIFVPFFEYFFDDCRAELDAVFFQSSSDKASASGSTKKKRRHSESSRESEGSDTARAARFFAALTEDDERMHLSLLQAVVGSLRLCFKYDTPSDGFMNRERVSAVAEPLVRHLALAAHDANYAAEAIAPSVAQLAAVAGVAEAWKTLNYSVLLLMREESSAVRLAALETLHNCFSTVGEEYLVMLPESLSFLSELLEDKDTRVEAKCRSVLRAVEELSGESLDSYL
jgi:U3 small nucleolar RNA-associated protein 10